MKNLIKNSIGGLVIILSILSCSTKTNEKKEATAKDQSTEMSAQNALTDQETVDGWKMLFDGVSTKGWRGYGKDHFPAVWQIENGAFFMQGNKGRTDEQNEDAGDIIFDQQFTDFHLKLEWKISEGGNSGIFYRGAETPEFSSIYYTAPEMQVLDNEKHPDAKEGKDGNRKAGSLYDLIPAVPQNAKPVGEWNLAEVIVNNGKIIHKQNGVVVVETEFGTPEWNELVAGSKFPGLNKNWADLPPTGYIGLQDHGNDVWYRNIKIKEF